MDFEFQDMEDLPYFCCLIRHFNGELYEARVLDTTEGGLILEVSEAHVKGGIFKEQVIDTRYIDISNMKLFFVHHFHTEVC